MKEMDAKGWRMGVWIRTLGSIPCLYSPVGSSPSGAALRAPTVRSAYPGTDLWAQDPLVSQRWMVRWWCSSAEMESPRILYVRHPVSSRNVATIALGPVISAEQ
jgi:hypothetical protein